MIGAMSPQMGPPPMSQPMGQPMGGPQMGPNPMMGQPMMPMAPPPPMPMGPPPYAYEQHGSSSASTTAVGHGELWWQC